MKLKLKETTIEVPDDVGEAVLKEQKGSLAPSLGQHVRLDNGYTYHMVAPLVWEPVE